MAGRAALVVGRARSSGELLLLGVARGAGVVAGRGSTMRSVATAAAQLGVGVEARADELRLRRAMTAAAGAGGSLAHRVGLVARLTTAVACRSLGCVGGERGVAGRALAVRSAGVVGLVTVGALPVLLGAVRGQDRSGLVVARHAPVALGHPLVRQVTAGTGLVAGLARLGGLRPGPSLILVAPIAGGRRIPQGSMRLMAALTDAMPGWNDVAPPGVDLVAAATVMSTLLTLPIVAMRVVAEPAIDLAVLDLGGRDDRGSIGCGLTTLIGRTVAATALVDRTSQAVADSIGEDVAGEAAIGVFDGVLRSQVRRLVQAVAGVAIEARRFDRARAMLIGGVTIQAGPLEDFRRMGAVTTSGRGDTP